MSENMKAVIADGNKNYVEALDKQLSLSGISVIAKTDDGKELYKIIQTSKPDIVIMELILKNLDGIEVLERLNSSKTQAKKPIVVVNTSLDSDEIVERMLKTGASIFVAKPIMPNELVRRINTYIERENENEQARSQEKSLDSAKIETEVSSMLKRIGVPAHLQGYKYLVAAICIVCEDPSSIEMVTSKIYPQIAEEFDTTAMRVERSIRYAIESAFDQGDITQINAIFGYTIDSARGKPTNSEFIAMVADSILIG